MRLFVPCLFRLVCYWLSVCLVPRVFNPVTHPVIQLQYSFCSSSQPFFFFFANSVSDFRSKPKPQPDPQKIENRKKGGRGTKYPTICPLVPCPASTQRCRSTAVNILELHIFWILGLSVCDCVVITGLRETKRDSSRGRLKGG